MAAPVPTIMMPAASASTVVVAATAASHMPRTMTMTMAALYEDDAIAVGQHIWFCDCIADADKMDVVISTHMPDCSKAAVASVLPSVGRVLAAERECFEDPTVCGNVTWPPPRLQQRFRARAEPPLESSRKQNAALLGGAALPGSSQTRCQIERISRDWRLSHHSGARQINGPSSGAS